MATRTVVDSLSDFLFRNRTQDKFQGLLIWTDQSVSEKAFEGLGRKEAVRVQVAVQNIQMTQRSRISEQVIKDGRAFFFWRKDKKSSTLDLLEIRLSGITRSLATEKKTTTGLPVIGEAIGGSDGPTPKQQEWLRFWRITREPFIVGDKINNHYIQLQTPALPIPITFIGHFSGPVQWTQSTENPFLANWELTLIVHRTDPSLDVIFEQALTVNVVGE